MILLIDNYDSFSYNLYQMVGPINPDIEVIRNDAMTLEEIRALAPAAIILSPGAGKPEDSGICIGVVQAFGATVPILGICLGYQSICAAFGATVSRARTLMHGKQSLTRLDTTCKLFYGCPELLPVARYHSLAVVESTIPPTLIVTARAEDGEILAVRHASYDIYGVQFHPESIMTTGGQQMLQNFLNIRGGRK